jgi:antitoxin (DNA-binding transcriptional repressor) of toxin-antitoxin stability system
MLAILANMDNVSTLPKPIEDMTMKTLSSVEVQNRFGSIANIVKSGEPVAVTQYGTPTMMILPYQLATEALRDYNARKLVEFMDVMPSANADAPNLTLEQLNKLVHELRP